MITVSYDRQKALDYCTKYALTRNPQYMDFSNIGGDCTNYCSQCIYAGSGVMNYTPTMGWYYKTPNNRAPAWSGVKFLYNFLTTNKSVGPFASVVPLEKVEIGDIIQLGDSTGRFYHSLFVSDILGKPSLHRVYISTHSADAYNRPLYTYQYNQMRCLHIEGVRKWS